MRDDYKREIDYMRISLTDRCNLRCRYCMPNDIELVPMREILTLEEIVTICEEAAKLGIQKLKQSMLVNKISPAPILSAFIAHSTASIPTSILPPFL